MMAPGPSDSGRAYFSSIRSASWTISAISPGMGIVEVGRTPETSNLKPLRTLGELVAQRPGDRYQRAPLVARGYRANRWALGVRAGSELLLGFRAGAVSERAVDGVGHCPVLQRTLRRLVLAEAVSLLVDVEGLPVGVEGGAAELGVVRERLGEVVDLALLRNAADVLGPGAILAEEHVARLRHDHHVVGVLELGVVGRLVDQRYPLAPGVVLPDLPEVVRAALGAVEEDPRLAVAALADPHALLAVEVSGALVLRLDAGRCEAGHAVTALVGVVVVVGVLDGHPLDLERHADRAVVHVGVELALELERLQAPGRVGEVVRLAAVLVRDVAVEAGADGAEHRVGLNSPVLRLVEDRLVPGGRLVHEASGGADRPGHHGSVAHRVHIEDIAVLLACRAAVDDLLAGDPLVERGHAPGAVGVCAAEDVETVEDLVGPYLLALPVLAPGLPDDELGATGGVGRVLVVAEAGRYRDGDLALAATVLVVADEDGRVRRGVHASPGVGEGAHAVEDAGRRGAVALGLGLHGDDLVVELGREREVALRYERPIARRAGGCRAPRRPRSEDVERSFYLAE